jgi:hypothetical protein
MCIYIHCLCFSPVAIWAQEDALLSLARLATSTPPWRHGRHAFLPLAALLLGPLGSTADYANTTGDYAYASTADSANTTDDSVTDTEDAGPPEVGPDVRPR